MKAKIHMIVGHYGSGKTEFAVNYVLSLRKKQIRTALADLDIVNPYFRSREQAAFLEEQGIHVVSSHFGNDWRVELPSLDSELYSFFLAQDRENFLDVGGNAAGARVLARFRDRILEQPYDMWLVMNANRFETQSADAVLEFLESIERMCGLKINGLVNNTHMLEETGMPDMIKGDQVAGEVSERTGIPYLYLTCPDNMYQECSSRTWGAELFPIHMYMRPDYLLQK